MTAIATRCLRLYMLLFASGHWSASAFDLRALRPELGAPFSIEFHATPGMFYSIEGSSNLTSWNILRTWRAPAADAAWTDAESFMAPFRFYRVGDLSDRIVVEGRITSPDGRGIPDHCPFCDILVSSSLDGNIAYTDHEGSFVLRTGAAATATNLPFTLYFSKIGFRPHTVVVTNPIPPRLEVMTLAGPSNNDFSNRIVISTVYTNAGNTALADVEQEEAGNAPSVWYSFTPPADGTLRFTVDTTEFLPLIEIFKGQALGSLQPVVRGSVSNWVEWRIEITQDLTVYAGEPLQIRVGALTHPTRGMSGGPFEVRSVFEPGFPLALHIAQPNTGTVALDPPPDETGRYKPGTVVTVQALPAPSYAFVGWSGSVDEMSESISLTMDAAKSLAPHFLLANGSSSNAVVITNGYPAGEGWIEGNQQLWYSWTPSRLTPLRIGFISTNFFHAAVYRRAGTNLVFVAGTGVGNLRGTSFWGSNGVTYLISMGLEPNQKGYCVMVSQEPVVVRALVKGPYSYRLTALFPEPEGPLTWNYNQESFEVWTALRYDPTLFPLTLSLSASGFRDLSVTAFENADRPVIQPNFSGPHNNDFTNRATLPGVSGQVNGSLGRASLEPGEPGLGDGSTWYEFTPPADGTLRLTIIMHPATNVTVWSGTTFDTLVLQKGWLLDQTYPEMTTEWAVKGGEPCQVRLAGQTNFLLGTLKYQFLEGLPLQITNATPQAGSIVVTPESETGRYVPGAIVMLTVNTQAGYKFTGWSGDITSTENPIFFPMDTLTFVKGNFALVNDDLANSLPLEGLPTGTTGTNLYGTAEPGEPAPGGFSATSSAWWRWTAPVTTDVKIDFDFDLSIFAGVYIGSNVSHLIPVANNLVGRNVRQMRFGVTAGTTYWIAADAYNGEGGPFSFRIDPVFEARYILYTGPVEGGYVINEPAPDGNTEYGSGEWVTLRAVSANAWEFAGWEEWTSGTAVDLGSDPELTVRMTSDRRIHPRFVASGAPRLNDHFSDRLILLTASAAVIADNRSATQETGEILATTNASGRTLWWSWTATHTAPIALSTAGSAVQNVLAVYTGDSIQNLTLVATDQQGAGDFASQVSFLAEAGTTYHICMDGVNGAAGRLRLRAAENEQFTLDLLSPSPGDSFAAPANVTLHFQALNSAMTVTQVNVSIVGLGDFTATNAAPKFIYADVPAGTYTFMATARDIRGRTASTSGYFHVNNYRFSAENYTGYSRNGVASFNIWRSGPTGVTSSVYFDVLPGTATNGSHYVQCTGRVTFFPGETNLAVTIPLLGDGEPRRLGYCRIALSSGPGHELVNFALLTLVDYEPISFPQWVNDTFPDGSTNFGDFEWIDTNPAPVSGNWARKSRASHGYTLTTGISISMNLDESLWQDVYFDADEMPQLVSITWTHGRFGPFYSRTVCWGDRSVAAGHGTWLGPLPTAGNWTQLKIPANHFGTLQLNGMSWNVINGTAVWDRTGKQVWK